MKDVGGLGTLPPNLDSLGLYPHTLSPHWSEPPGLLQWPPHWLLDSALTPTSTPHMAAGRHPGAPKSQTCPSQVVKDLQHPPRLLLRGGAQAPPPPSLLLFFLTPPSPFPAVPQHPIRNTPAPGPLHQFFCPDVLHPRSPMAPTPCSGLSHLPLGGLLGSEHLEPWPSSLSPILLPCCSLLPSTTHLLTLSACYCLALVPVTSHSGSGPYNIWAVNPLHEVPAGGNI